MYLKGVYFSLTYPNGNGPCRRVDDQQINIDLSKIHPGAYDMLAHCRPNWTGNRSGKVENKGIDLSC